MAREQLKMFMRQYVKDEMVKVEKLINKYQGQDKDTHLKNFEKCNGLIKDQEKYLRHDTLVKLTQYVELAQRKLKKLM